MEIRKLFKTISIFGIVVIGSLSQGFGAKIDIEAFRAANIDERKEMLSQANLEEILELIKAVDFETIKEILPLLPVPRIAELLRIEGKGTSVCRLISFALPTPRRIEVGENLGFVVCNDFSLDEPDESYSEDESDASDDKDNLDASDGKDNSHISPLPLPAEDVNELIEMLRNALAIQDEQKIGIIVDSLVPQERVKVLDGLSPEEIVKLISICFKAGFGNLETLVFSKNLSQVVAIMDPELLLRVMDVIDGQDELRKIIDALPFQKFIQIIITGSPRYHPVMEWIGEVLTMRELLELLKSLKNSKNIPEAFFHLNINQIKELMLNADKKHLRMIKIILNKTKDLNTSKEDIEFLNKIIQSSKEDDYESLIHSDDMNEPICPTYITARTSVESLWNFYTQRRALIFHILEFEYRVHVVLSEFAFFIELPTIFKIPTCYSESLTKEWLDTISKLNNEQKEELVTKLTQLIQDSTSSEIQNEATKVLRFLESSNAEEIPNVQISSDAI